ncbi:SMR family transporter [Enterobacter bugandensis]|uniref:SMR family transporter n=1 Tax=Enterobacter bugandensis TaxID=881260 RepID=UPI0013D701DC|nr:SMR family transporter [Enterobacter bugandensis]
MNILKLTQNQRVVSWAFLMLAIIAEVVGTSFMTSAARDGGYAGYMLMALFLAISYYFLALSIRTIGVGVAYAIWEGVGLLLLTIIGVYFFNDILTSKELMGIIIAVIGIICVTLGEEH